MVSPDAKTINEWRASLQAVAQYEYAPEILKERLSSAGSSGNEYDQPLPSDIEVGVCGSGKRGAYQLVGKACFANAELNAQVSFCAALNLWVLTSARDDGYDHGGAVYSLPRRDRPELLYASFGPEPTAAWFTVMGFNPAPSVTKLHHLADLNIDSVFANPLIPLHGPCVANVFESVFDLRRVRWDINNFGVQGPLPDISTAQDIAAQLLALHECTQLAAVCRSWHQLVATYVRSWPEAIRNALHLHCEPVLPLRHLLALLAQTSGRSSVASLPNQIWFKETSWPAYARSVRISSISSQSGLFEHQRVFAVFALHLLRDITLPWCKCMRGNSSLPSATCGPVACLNGVNCKRGSLESGIIEGEMYSDFLIPPCLKGSQALSPTLWVHEGKLLARNGEPIDGRLPEALQKLRLISSLPWNVLGRSVSWVTQIRETPKEPCYFCKQGLGDERRCTVCEDKREWAYLTYNYVVSFEMPRFDFVIECRILPFLSTSDDQKHVGLEAKMPNSACCTSGTDEACESDSEDSSWNTFVDSLSNDE